VCACARLHACVCMCAHLRDFTAHVSVYVHVCACVRVCAFVSCGVVVCVCAFMCTRTICDIFLRGMHHTLVRRYTCQQCEYFYAFVYVFRAGRKM